MYACPRVWLISQAHVYVIYLNRQAVPDIPLQMLLRGANAVGYTSCEF